MWHESQNCYFQSNGRFESDLNGTLLQAYTDWAQDYDRDLSALKSVGNDLLAKHSIDLINNEQSSLMLDIAAGKPN